MDMISLNCQKSIIELFAVHSIKKINKFLKNKTKQLKSTRHYENMEKNIHIFYLDISERLLNYLNHHKKLILKHLQFKSTKRTVTTHLNGKKLPINKNFSSF